MSTKKQVESAVRQLRGTLELEENEDKWMATIRPPANHLWSDIRFHFVHVSISKTEEKSTFWSEVLLDLEDAGLAVPCTEHSCVEWEHEDACCGYWQDKLQ